MTDRLQDGIGDEKLHPSTKGKATASNSTKKRATSVKAAAGEHEIGEAPAKRAKVRTSRSDLFLSRSRA